MTVDVVEIIPRFVFSVSRKRVSGYIQDISAGIVPRTQRAKRSSGFILFARSIIRGRQESHDMPFRKYTVQWTRLICVRAMIDL